MSKKVLLCALILLIALLVALPALADPPSSSGPNVVRYDDTIAIWYPDQARGLSVVLGVDVVEDCNGNFNPEVASFQDIHVPEDANRIIQIIQGDDLLTTVWPFSVFDCALFTNVEPVATGTSDLTLTDNDLLVYLTPDNVNWNAFGFMAQGDLTAQDGSKVQFNGVSRCLWDGNNGETFSCVDRIIVR